MKKFYFKVGIINDIIFYDISDINMNKIKKITVNYNKKIINIDNIDYKIIL